MGRCNLYARPGPWDHGNVSDEERQKLLDFFQRLGKRAVVRETHFFITQDAEIKDQGGVQYVLRSTMEYLQGRGKWARQRECATCGSSLPAAEGAPPSTNKCPTCNGVANYFGQQDLDPFEVNDREYYQGNGAPARGTTFQWFKAFSDGFAQKFMNATFYFHIIVFYFAWYLCCLELVLLSPWKMCL